MSKVRVLVVLPFDHPEHIMWVSTMPASLVDLNFNPLSWLGWMKLYSLGNYFFDKFTEGVEENNGAKRFQTIVRCLVWFGNDDCGGSFEVIRPMT